MVTAGDNNWGQCSICKWSNIIKVVCGDNYTVGLKATGQVAAAGQHKDGQTSVSQWSDVVGIACCPSITYGLKADGTVVVTGKDTQYSRPISTWGDILMIKSSGEKIIALRADGTVASGESDVSAEATNWENIVSFSEGRNQFFFVIITADGTLEFPPDGYYHFVGKEHMRNWDLWK